jgi:hypothetical protein
MMKISEIEEILAPFVRGGKNILFFCELSTEILYNLN